MSRIVNPYQTFRDDSGVVVSDGTLTFYENETTTKKIIYADADLTTEQSNPYTLDGYGRVQGDVFLDGTYSVELKDSDGNTIRTVDDVESLGGAVSGGSETVQGSVRNKFINGSCRFPSTGGSVNISGSYQESEVKDIFVKADGTPTNGTLDQVKTTSVGTTGYAQQVTDLTTGAGGTVDYRFRFLSKDSRDLVDKAAVFQAAVLHNVGSSITYTVSVYTATAEDDFTTVSLISASSGTSVSSDTATTLLFPVSDMGDCSNGVEVRVSAGCGAVTTKDFYIADVVWRKGAAQIVFEQLPYDRDEAALDALKGVNNLSDVASATTSRDNLAFPVGYIDGLRIESDTDTDHDIKVNTGRARDAADTANIILSSVITKQLDANWAEGDDSGGLASAVTLSGPELLNFFIISKDDGTADAGWDTSDTAANLLSDATGYSYYRMIGQTRTDSSNNIATVVTWDPAELVVETFSTATSFTWEKPSVRNITNIDVTYVAGGGGGAEATTSGSDGGTTSFEALSANGGGGGNNTNTGGSYTDYSGANVSRGRFMQTGGGDDGASGASAAGGDSPFLVNGSGGTGGSNGVFGGGGSAGTGASAESGGGGSGARYMYDARDLSSASITVGAGGSAGGDGGAGGDGYVTLRY